MTQHGRRPQYGPPVPGPAYPPRYLPVPPPPREPTTLGRPLAWAIGFSLLGVVAALAVLAALLLFLAFLLFALVAMLSEDYGSGDFFEWLSLGDAWSELASGAGVVVLVLFVVTAILVTGALLLLRISRSVQTWAPALQGLAAAGVVYTVASVVLMVAGQFVGSGG